MKKLTITVLISTCFASQAFAQSTSSLNYRDEPGTVASITNPSLGSIKPTVVTDVVPVAAPVNIGGRIPNMSTWSKAEQAKWYTNNGLTEKANSVLSSMNPNEQYDYKKLLSIQPVVQRDVTGAPVNNLATTPGTVASIKPTNGTDVNPVKYNDTVGGGIPNMSTWSKAEQAKWFANNGLQSRADALLGSMSPNEIYDYKKLMYPQAFTQSTSHAATYSPQVATTQTNAQVATNNSSSTSNYAPTQYNQATGGTAGILYDTGSKRVGQIGYGGGASASAVNNQNTSISTAGVSAPSVPDMSNWSDQQKTAWFNAHNGQTDQASNPVSTATPGTVAFTSSDGVKRDVTGAPVTPGTLASVTSSNYQQVPGTVASIKPTGGTDLSSADIDKLRSAGRYDILMKMGYSINPAGGVVKAVTNNQPISLTPQNQ